MNTRLLTTLIASLFLVACGGGGGDDDDTVDSGIHFIDANVNVTYDAPPAACTVTTSNTGPAQTAGKYACGNGSALCDTADPSAADYISAIGPLNADTLPDVLWIELVSGAGPFTDGLVTGTFDLATGDEVNYASCGACVTISSDSNTGTGDYVDDYFQTAGTLQITGFTTGDGDATPSTVSGHVSGLTLTHVTVDWGGTYQSTAVGDCDTTVADFDFTANLVDYAAE